MVDRKQYLPRCAVTLVHGSIPRAGSVVFFRKHQWMESQSIFCKQISAHFDPIWLPFIWSGTNSHTARTNAGKQLADTLHHHLALHPSIPHYVISHSHGGNVALYALKYLTEQERHKIAGIVTLGTPFIWSSMRDVASVRETLMKCLKYGPIVWLILYIAASLYLDSLFTFLGIFSLSIGILGIILWMAIRKYSIGTWEQAADQLDALLDAGVPTIPLLCLVVNRDEALLWIRIWESVGRLLFGHWYMSAVEIIIDLLTIFRSPRLILVGIDMYFYSIIATGISWGLGLLFVLVIFAGSALTISSPWGYGETWFLRWVVFITTREIPHNRAEKNTWIFKSNLISLGLNYENDDCLYKVQRFRPRFWSFNHGWLHDDIEVAASIALWMRSLLREDVPVNALGGNEYGISGYTGGNS